MFLQEDQEIFPLSDLLRCHSLWLALTAIRGYEDICFVQLQFFFIWVIKGLDFVQVCFFLQFCFICAKLELLIHPWKNNPLGKQSHGNSSYPPPPIPPFSAELVGAAARMRWAHAVLLWQLSICATNGTFIEGQQWQLASINPEAHRGLSKPHCVHGSHQWLEQLNYVWVQ